jgi:predicted DNA-binding transcriptional regulator YafY
MMEVGIKQKLKFLYLAKIFIEKTDSKIHLTTSEIISELARYGIQVTSKTLREDIELLIDFEMNIKKEKFKENFYWLEDRTFELSELKLLVDAVQSSKMIPEMKSLKLMSKLETLCSQNEAYSLKRSIYVFNRVKSRNEQIFKNVDLLHQALLRKTKIEFYYIEYDPNGKKKYKRNEIYSVHPCGLIWHEDNYYLLAFNERYMQISPFRVDRMENITVKKEVIMRHKIIQNFRIENYTDKTFNMYATEELTEVQLLFDNQLATVVVDRFGEDVNMHPYCEKRFKVTIKVGVSPTFVAWLFTFGRDVEVIYPLKLREDIKKLALSVYQNYNKKED